MLTPIGRRFEIGTVLAVVSAALGLLTLLWRDWLEVTGWNPDRLQEGAVEWMIAALFLLVALVSGALARTR